MVILPRQRNKEVITQFKLLTNQNNITTTVNVSHLLYADDTLIFCEADKSQVFYLNLTLQLLEALSRLHVNKQKSIIYPVNSVPKCWESHLDSHLYADDT